MRILVSMLCLLFIFSSCSKDEENKKFIGKYVGVVDCPDGEEGIVTTIDITAKGDSETAINAVLDSDGDIIQLTGNVSGSSIVFDKTNVEFETFLSGTGTLSDNTLTVSFTIFEGSDSYTCVFTGKK